MCGRASRPRPHPEELTDEHTARAEETARVASHAGATAGAIFERRDPVKTLAMQPQIVEVLSTIFDPEIPVNIYELGLSLLKTRSGSAYRVAVVSKVAAAELARSSEPS
jgi:hypothetical protein